MQPQAATKQLPVSQQDNQLIARIVQLAKLGSDPNAIDPLLDVLRTTTATREEGAPLQSQDRTRLQGIEKKLRAYLVTQDPLRRFTPESLEAYLQVDSQPVTVGINRDLITTLVAAVCMPLLALALPLFSAFPLQKSLLLTIPLFLVVLHIDIAWLYISALTHFKPEFKRAFFFVCVGILLFSVAFSHYVLIELLELGQAELFRYGGLTLLDASCYFFMYIGLRQYAQLLGIKSFAVSWPKVTLIALGLSLVAIVIPHTGQRPFEPYFDVSLIGIWLFSMFLALNAVVSSQIVKSVTPAYARSLRWLRIYFIAAWIGSLGSAFGLPIVGQLNGGFLYVLIAILGIIPQLLLLYTGYLFKKETST